VPSGMKQRIFITAGKVAYLTARKSLFFSFYRYYAPNGAEFTTSTS